jgi:hypothetical protein
MSELPEFALGLVAVAQGTARIERGGRALKLGDRTVGLAGLSECAARERARERRLDRSADLVSGTR